MSMPITGHARGDSEAVCPPAKTSETAKSTCWGLVLSNGATHCEPGFVQRVGHFKNKICAMCTTNGFFVDNDRIRVLPEGASGYINPCSHGCWSVKDGIHFRVINQTAKCKGPPMLLLQTVAEAEKTGLPPLPKPYLSDSGRLHLVVSCGTLTPKRQTPTTPYVPQYVSPDPTVAPGSPPCALAIEWVESARLRRSPVKVEPQHIDALHGVPSTAALPLACPYALPAPDEPGARVNKRSRAMFDAPGDLAPQAPTPVVVKGNDKPDASALLELATLHASFLTKIQEELERTDDNPDPDLVEYRKALTKISAPLADATLCLSRLTSGVRRAPAAIDGVHVRGSLRRVNSFDGISETSDATTVGISASHSVKSESSQRMELMELEELAQVTSDADTESSRTQNTGWDAAAAAESLVDSFLA